MHPTHRPNDQQLLEDIVLLLKERQELTKEEICLVFGIEDDVYERVRDELGGRKGVRKLGGQTGGLALDRRVGIRSDAESALPLSDIQRHAVNRLEAILPARVLVALADTRMANELVIPGASLQMSPRRAAEVLVLHYDLDLLWYADLRRAIGQALGIAVPGRWHAGKGGAVQFVRDAGFPIEFAGIVSGERPDDVEIIEPYGDLPPLEGFQQELQRLIVQILREDAGRAIASLPTGAGKTRTAVEAVIEWFASDPRGSGTIVLWLAHTEELCEQACEAFRQVWSDRSMELPLRIMRRFGGLRAPASALQDGEMPTVVVTTPAALDHVADASLVRAEIQATIATLPDHVPDFVRARVLEELERQHKGRLSVKEESLRFFELIGLSLGAVVIDEAHRSAAQGYKRILEWCRTTRGAPSIVGLTATPFRAGGAESEETRSLSALFDHRLLEPLELHPDPRTALQARAVLAVPEVRGLASGMRIRPLPQDEFRRDEVMRLWTDNRARRRIVVEELVAILEDPDASVLYFGPSVSDAHAVALLLRLHGHAAQALSGTTRREVRRSIVQRFRKRELRILCNCELLTTGFDAPKVSHVVVGRPTTSQVLYEQMVGRGLRGPRFGGTATCTIIDVQDEFVGPRPRLGYDGFREHWQPQVLQLAPRGQLPL